MNKIRRAGVLSRTLTALLALAMAFIGPAIAAGDPVMPDKARNVSLPVGERLVFKLKWWFVEAGEATLEILPDTVVNGQPARHFVLTARTNDFVDNFYKVRDRIDAYTDLALTRTLHYTKNQHEGDHHRDVVVHLDWEEKRARYVQNGVEETSTRIVEGAFDPLSIFYAFRKLDLAPGRELNAYVTDGKKCVLGKASLKQREKVAVPAGEFDTWLVEPEMRHIGGVFKQKEGSKLQLWVTSDDARRVVKIRSAVAVGHFTAELERIERVTAKK
ncbi:MAG: DUF3108 domain-containing protein [Desulfatibacillaceae bacterium]